MSRLFRTCLLSGAILALAAPAAANECYSQMPAGVRPVGDAKLCLSAFSGRHRHYGCQDYRRGEDYYRVIYQGGLGPKAIIRLDGQHGEQLIWSPRFGDRAMRCPLPAPTTVPRHATHRGLGICQDEHDMPVACSVYEHAGPRQSKTYRYLVFYQQDGRGSRLAHRMTTGTNLDAMVAELAYQIGLSLMETRCCHERAGAYLQQAHRLFPMAPAYRAGYLKALEQLATSADNPDL